MSKLRQVTRQMMVYLNTLNLGIIIQILMFFICNWSWKLQLSMSTTIPRQLHFSWLTVEAVNVQFYCVFITPHPNDQNNEYQHCRPTVVERSESSSQLRSWMRKVVGSSPGEDLYRISFLLWKHRLKGDCFKEMNWNDINAMKTKQEVVRINLLRVAFIIWSRILMLILYSCIWNRI